MNIKRQKKEVLDFLNESFDYNAFNWNINYIELKGNKVSNKCVDFEGKTYIFSKVEIPEKFDIEDMPCNDFLKKRKYKLKLNGNIYILTLNYTSKTIFDESLMSDTKNLKEFENLFDFLLVPKKIIIKNLDGNIVFESKLKVQISIFKIRHALSLILKDKVDLVEELFEKIHDLKVEIGNSNQGTKNYLSKISISSDDFFKILNFHKGEFYFKDYKISITEENQTYLLTQDFLRLKIVYVLKHITFMDQYGNKTILKWFKRNLF